MLNCFFDHLSQTRISFYQINRSAWLVWRPRWAKPSRVSTFLRKKRHPKHASRWMPDVAFQNVVLDKLDLGSSTATISSFRMKLDVLLLFLPWQLSLITSVAPSCLYMEIQLTRKVNLPVKFLKLTCWWWQMKCDITWKTIKMFTECSDFNGFQCTTFSAGIGGGEMFH